MFNLRRILVTFALLYFTVFINCQEGVLSQIRDEFREPLIDCKRAFNNDIL
jgi:hypothetical protein